MKVMVLGLTLCSVTAFAELSSGPYASHWTGEAKDGNWFNSANWAEGVVPGVYTTNAGGILTTNGCRGCTAVFGRVPADNIDGRRLIKANPYTFNPNGDHCLLSIGHIVFDGKEIEGHSDYVMPAYVVSNGLTWQYEEPFLPLEGGGSVELKDNVTEPVYFDTFVTLGANETTSQTFHFVNNSAVAVAFHRLTAYAGSYHWSKDPSVAGETFLNVISFEGTGDIEMMVAGALNRNKEEYAWSLAMDGGRVLVRKAYNLGSKAYANVAPVAYKLLVPADGGRQILDIEDGCSLELGCKDGPIADINSDLKISGDGTFYVISDTNANREFYINNGAKVEIAGTISNKSTGGFVSEKAGLRLVSTAGGGEFFVSGVNAIPGAVQITDGITYVASTIGNVGEHGELGEGQRIWFSGTGTLKYVGAGEQSTKFLYAGGSNGFAWNAGSGDLFFSGVRGVWSDYKLVLTNDGVHAIGLTGDIASSCPIVAPGALVKFAPPAGANAVTIDVANIAVRGATKMEIADGTTVRIHALPQDVAGSSVDVKMNADGGARLFIEKTSASVVPGAAPAWIRVNGLPARFTESSELIGIEEDDLEISARGDAVPDAPLNTVSITSEGTGERDTLAKDETTVVLLRNRVTTVSPVVDLGDGQKLIAASIESVEGAAPIVFMGAGVLASPFNLIGGTVVRSNETTGASFAIKAETLSQVSLTGLPNAPDAAFSVAVSGGKVDLSPREHCNMNKLLIDGGADAVLSDGSMTFANSLCVGETGLGRLVIENGTTITGLVKVAGWSNSTGSLVQNGGEVFTEEKGNAIVGGQASQGYYELNDGRIVNYAGGNQICVGSQGTAVFAQYGGEIDVTDGAFQVQARDDGYSLFYQKSGLLWQTTTGADLYMCSCGNNGQGAWIIDGPNAVSRASSGRNFVLGGSHDSTTDRTLNYVLAINNGGLIHAASIVATKNHKAKVHALVCFDGGIFCNNANYGSVFDVAGGAWFDPVDHVLVFENGMTMQADIDCSTRVPIEAPAGKGVSSIVWTDMSAAFVGSPAVRITGDGEGATAVAEYDSTTRTVSGIRVTSPGCNYTEAVAEVLYGNDGNAAKVFARLPCELRNNVSGGFRKTGGAKFTFHAVNTYAGATTIEKGTLALGASDVINPKSALVLSGGTLDMNNNSQTFADITCNGGAIVNGRALVTGLQIDFAEAMAGVVKHVDMSKAFDYAPNAAVTLINYDPAILDHEVVSRYTLAEFSNGVPEGLDLSKVPVPDGWEIKMSGNRLKLSYRTGIMIMVR